MKKSVKAALYVALFFFCLIFFIYWTLPTAMFKSRLILEAERALGNPYRVSIEKLKTWRISGVRLFDLEISRQTDGKEEVLLVIDRLHVRAGIFSFLLGKPYVRFVARIGNAKIRGEIAKQEERWRLKVDCRELDFKNIAYLRVASGLKVRSEIDAEMDIRYLPKTPFNSDGKIRLELDGLQIDKGDLSLGEMGSLPLPDLQLAGSGSVVDLELGDGGIKVKELKFKARDLNLDLAGRVFLAPQVSNYRMNLRGTFRFSENLWGILEPNLPEPWLKKLKEQEDTAGNYPLSVSGQFASPQVYSGTFKIVPLQLF